MATVDSGSGTRDVQLQWTEVTGKRHRRKQVAPMARIALDGAGWVDLAPAAVGYGITLRRLALSVTDQANNRWLLEANGEEHGFVGWILEGEPTYIGPAD